MRLVLKKFHSQHRLETLTIDWPDETQLLLKLVPELPAQPLAQVLILYAYGRVSFRIALCFDLLASHISSKLHLVTVTNLCLPIQ